MAEDLLDPSVIPRVLKDYELVMTKDHMTNIVSKLKDGLRIPDDWVIATSRRETEGQKNPTKAINGQYVGVLQIGPGVVKDVNERFKTNYTLKDRNDPQKSAEMFHLYNARYGSTNDPIDYVTRRWKEGVKGWTNDTNPKIRDQIKDVPVTSKQNALIYHRYVADKWNKLRMDVENARRRK
jgi:hypothetical protein